MTQTYVRVPPQSTGKRVLTTERYLLKYDNLTGSFSVGQIVTGVTSSAQGTITSIDTDGFGVNEGVLWLTEVTGTFVNDENLQVSAVTQAVSNITGTYPFESYSTQNINIVDPENPSHKQRIDRFGSQLTTFADGAPTFGAFGTLQVGEPQVIKDYRFAYDSDAANFYDFDSAGGSVSYDQTAGLILLSTGTTSGDHAQRTSNFYHPYAPGVGQIAEMTVRVGDAGKANVRRRWGYFDDSDGVFFELDGTTLYSVVRSSVSGSVVDTRVAQTDWNVDPLDGSDNIGFNLILENPNIYFIDLQWLGSGRVRFGIIEPEGSRLVAHVIENANTAGDFPYMRTATLPIRIEQENIGSAASSSEMRMVCCAVKHTAKSTPVGTKFALSSPLKTIADSNGEVPIFAYRPKTTFNGLTNRALTKGISTSLMNNASSPVLFRVRSGTDAILTGESFVSSAANSTTEYDTSATAVSGGNEILNVAVSPNSTEFLQDIADRELHTFEINLGADGITQPLLVITAELMGDSGGETGRVLSGINWEELKA